MAPHNRLRATNIPWLYHLTILIACILLRNTSSIHTFIFLQTLVTICLDTEAILQAYQDPSEPPMIPHPYLPFLGHVIGMFMHGSNYFAIVNHRTQHPIFTLQTLNKKTVGVISPQLAALIQRASKNTSFYGMILEVTKRLVDFDEPSMKVIRYNLDDELGHHEGLMNESHDMVASILSPGPILNQLLTTQLEVVAEMMNELVPSFSSSVTLNFMDFIKKTIHSRKRIHDLGTSKSLRFASGAGKIILGLRGWHGPSHGRHISIHHSPKALAGAARCQ
jgi:hypothetical protein